MIKEKLMLSLKNQDELANLVQIGYLQILSEIRDCNELCTLFEKKSEAFGYIRALILAEIISMEEWVICCDEIVDDAGISRNRIEIFDNNCNIPLP